MSQSTKPILRSGLEDEQQKLSQGGGAGAASPGTIVPGVVVPGVIVEKPSSQPLQEAMAAVDDLGGHSVVGHEGASNGTPPPLSGEAVTHAEHHPLPLSGAPISHSAAHRLDTPLKSAKGMESAEAENDKPDKREREGGGDMAPPELLKRAKNTSSISPAPAAPAAAPPTTNASPPRA